MFFSLINILSHSTTINTMLRELAWTSEGGMENLSEIKYIMLPRYHLWLLLPRRTAASPPTDRETRPFEHDGQRYTCGMGKAPPLSSVWHVCNPDHHSTGICLHNFLSVHAMGSEAQQNRHNSRRPRPFRAHVYRMIGDSEGWRWRSTNCNQSTKRW